MGSTVLDWADDDLERLEIRSCVRAAGNGNRVAAQTVQTILVEVVSAKRARATARKFGDSEAGQKHGCRQPTLGRTSDTRGTPKTRIRDFRANSFTTDAERRQKGFANLGNVSAQSCWPTCFCRFLHDCDNSITRAVCFCGAGTRPSSCSISMSPNTPQRSGLHNKSLRHFRRTVRHDIWFGIEMESMVIPSRQELKEWALSRFGLRRGVLGKIVTWNV